jgi:hypothetical protein
MAGTQHVAHTGDRRLVDERTRELQKIDHQLRATR